MDSYIVTQIVKAEPIALGNFNKEYKLDIPGSQSELGYVVISSGMAVTWLSKQDFEKHYRKIKQFEIEMMV